MILFEIISSFGDFAILQFLVICLYSSLLWFDVLVETKYYKDVLNHLVNYRRVFLALVCCILAADTAYYYDKYIPECFPFTVFVNIAVFVYSVFILLTLFFIFWPLLSNFLVLMFLAPYLSIVEASKDKKSLLPIYVSYLVTNFILVLISPETLNPLFFVLFVVNYFLAVKDLRDFKLRLVKPNDKFMNAFWNSSLKPRTYIFGAGLFTFFLDQFLHQHVLATFFYLFIAIYIFGALLNWWV